MKKSLLVGALSFLLVTSVLSVGQATTSKTPDKGDYATAQINYYEGEIAKVDAAIAYNQRELARAEYLAKTYPSFMWFTFTFKGYGVSITGTMSAAQAVTTYRQWISNLQGIKRDLQRKLGQWQLSLMSAETMLLAAITSGNVYAVLAAIALIA